MPDLKIIAYYTIALKPLVLGRNVSKTFHKKLEGVSVSNNILPAFLIGQLGRNDNYQKDDLSGGEMLSFVFDTISKVQTLIGGRIVLVECEDVPEIRAFYENNGFDFLKSRTNDDYLLIQYVKLIIS